MTSLRKLLLLGGLLIGEAEVSYGMDYGLGLRMGSVVSPVPAVGLETYVGIGDFEIGLSHVTGERNIVGEISSATSAITIEEAIAWADMTLLEVRYEILWGINLNLGVGQRTMGLRYKIVDSDTPQNALAGDLIAKSIVMGHSFGLRWVGDLFYFGFDGIGHYYPLSTTAESSVRFEGNVTGDASAEEDVDDAAAELGNVITKQLFLINIGMEF